MPLAAQPAARGRRVISVIGVDHYARWPRLHNAVNDARAVEAAFLELGFETVAPSLFDAQATRAAIDDLFDALGRRLTSDDHLVVFFAGHGGTITRRTGAREVTTGYLIPVDGTHVDDRPGSLFELDALLLRISRFSALHILVILDACYAGLALAPSSILQRPRGGGPPAADPYERLHARASRILIASTLDNEQAQDGGALPGHSLFTACLLHALVRDMPRIDLGGGRSGVHASSLGVYVRDHVHLGQLGARQTPDFGRFGNDDRGDMPIVLDPAGGLRVAPRGSTPRLAYAGGTPRAAEEPALAAILPVNRARPIALAGLA
ncbi:MAG TPA: caspase family protein, partial [Kofleriaceae bacterium]|nr:caspase family protein [Kofleriaceae bacterium]